MRCSVSLCKIVLLRNCVIKFSIAGGICITLVRPMRLQCSNKEHSVIVTELIEQGHFNIVVI